MATASISPSSPSSKRRAYESPVSFTRKRVGTHNGSFHCDEALGCFMIRLTDKFFDAEVVLDTLDAVLDVGGVYDPSNDRYDHHRKGFQEVLVMGFMEVQICGCLLNVKYFEQYRFAIDAIDNGINKYDTDLPPRYVNNTGLSSRVGRLNLDWIDRDQSAEIENEAYHRAMAINVRFHAKSWLPARSIVMECLAARHEVDPSGEIMTLKSFCPVAIYTSTMPKMKPATGTCNHHYSQQQHQQLHLLLIYLMS
ncbi:hypothetical protein MKW94_005421, partial [Papaver nudicaule]|nr:hypothetical protein [Papaver nudicaule]